LQLQEFSLRNPTVDYSTSTARRAAFSVTLKEKVVSILVEDPGLRINLNMMGHLSLQKDILTYHTRKPLVC
jgi:hypothetical protein